ncbi:type III secretion system cytoplasmic ring protein SctQ [Chlamydia caviae]|uniref:Type III secretion translocase SctQ n=1 Tax=Chlamydia caviae (strain ATCC VR-813 / DSM 19441 / 03DC25 / GPIC) TaxID=227941 RepID=Q824V1_CHLCV|nr:type III secretion system cytoplasmic ring protein SctQ [Chlamydia caviae]AAP04790.1 type III secretion translocase SctQ [Chlamydia caviae GPIC]
MAVAAEPSTSWLKSRNDFLSSLVKTEEGVSLPPFPEDLCQQKLKEKFRLEDTSLTIQPRGSLSAAQAVKDFGTHLLVQSFLAQPLDSGTFFFVTSEADLQSFMVAVFNDSSLASYFYEKDKLLGFHYYFCAELCKLLQELAWIPSLSARVVGDARFSSKNLQESYQAVDITFGLDGNSMRFRLLFPEALCDSCQKFLSASNQNFDVHQLDPTPLTMSVEVGYCQLTQDEWQQVVHGSFILLDSCLYDPDTEESGGLLTVQGHQFFGGRFLDPASGEFKITSYPNLQQEEPTKETPEVLPAAPLPGNCKLVAEASRYSLTVEEFLKLTQGSVLNFNGVHPSRGVDLILNGAKVGRGEIVSLGDVLGIRVLEV